jgi:hypothetical protein
MSSAMSVPSTMVRLTQTAAKAKLRSSTFQNCWSVSTFT